jgi:protein-disulfide isomerase
MNKFTVGAIAVVLLAFGGLVVWSSFNSGNKTNFGDYNTQKVIKADENNGNISDHVRGKEDSEVVLVEYADLQCPGCATMMPKISQLYEKYGDRVAFIFRNYPISGHQNARAAAAAAEAAGLQGYYWDMLETMYDNRADWINVFDTEKRTNIYVGYFKNVSDDKGDVEKFKNDLGSADIQKKIDFDKNIGSKRDNISATPSFFINGKSINIDGDGEVKDIIESAINEALEKANIVTGAKEDEKEDKKED